jgi:hypothetical protein
MAAIAMAVVFIPSAFAVHDTGAFELDGNATNNPAVTGDDWDNVCHQVTITEDTTSSIPDQCSSASNTTGAVGVAWAAEPNLNSSIFTGGGSKDPQNVSSWAWKDGAGGLPDKDNLLHAYAAEYSLTGTDKDGNCPNGTDLNGGTFNSAVKCQVIYFGSDRYDNSGDAQQGFWFFQNEIGLGSNSISGGSGFTGVHKNGDVLVISDFSNGGTTSTITVYKWDSTCTKAVNSPQPGQCGDANLRLLSTSTDALCDSSLAGNDNACGIVNSGTITMPWSFTDKSGTANNGALNGEFFEAGVNLSNLGLAGECFSSVASETRSSTSTTATLKDFVLSGFQKCAPALTTKASTNLTNVAPGSAVTDTAYVTVSGATSPDDAQGTVQFYLCGPITGPDACTSTSNPIGSPVTLNNTDCSSPTSSSTTDGISCALSLSVNDSGQTGARGSLGVGRYCFGATATLTNYTSPTAAPVANECFTVADTSSTSTAQNWLPNDTATVTLGSGGAASGSVTFTLYSNGTCTAGASNANVLHTFGPITLDSNGQASTSNTTFAIATSTGETISWRVTYSSGNSNVGGSTSHCETSTVTINDDTGS